MGAHPTRPQRETELGLEVQCTRCREFWPADSEFFYFHGGKPHSWCKACYRADEKVRAKIERWKSRQRKYPEAQLPPAPEWGPLMLALGQQQPLMPEPT